MSDVKLKNPNPKMLFFGFSRFLQTLAKNIDPKPKVI